MTMITTGALRIPPHAKIALETSNQLPPRRKAVLGLPLTEEEEVALGSSLEYQRAEHWIARQTGGYGRVAPAPPKVGAALSR